ncbi:MAG: RCC1 domain-containing protein, partial [Myxococcota bacterium]
MVACFQSTTMVGALCVLVSFWGCFRHNGDEEKEGLAEHSLLQQLTDEVPDNTESSRGGVEKEDSKPSEPGSSHQSSDANASGQDSQQDVEHSQQEQSQQASGQSPVVEANHGVVEHVAVQDNASVQLLEGKLSAGRYNTCAISATGTLHCWGPMTAIRTAIAVFTDVFSLFHFVSVGETDACVIQNDDTLLCWGLQDAIVDVPASVGPVQAVSVGKKHACALQKPTGFLRCWGDAT